MKAISHWILTMTVVVLLASACSNDDDSDGGGEKAQIQCQSPSLATQAIYGPDDRRDWYQVSDPALITWARSTVALIPRTNISVRGDVATVRSANYQDTKKLCSDQPYLEQPTAAFCSGFYVGNNLVVTAGHCLANLKECQSTAFVFDYAVSRYGDNPSVLPGTSVYHCKRILAHRSGADDYAIVELDRAVQGRIPFSIRRTGSPTIRQSVVMIGHPTGLPSKIAAGGRVMAVNSRIVADVDAFGGNSGSAVVDSRSGRVEGILVSGNTDFTRSGGCYVEHRCGKDCDGERIFPITKLAKLIPPVHQGPTSENVVMTSRNCH